MKHKKTVIKFINKMLSLLNKSEIELFPHHEHITGECTCNLYGYLAMQILSNKSDKYLISIFLLKFKILFNILNLQNSKINKKWYENFNGESCSLPFEIEKFNIKKFESILKSFNKDLTLLNSIDLDNLQIYLPIFDFKIRRINYPKQNNPQVFEYYTIEKTGKYYTYLPPHNIKSYLSQFNIVVSILDKLVIHPSCLENIDFKKIDEYAEKIEKSTFLNGLFDNNNNIYIKRDIQMISEIEENPEKLFEIIMQYSN